MFVRGNEKEEKTGRKEKGDKRKEKDRINLN